MSWQRVRERCLLALNLHHLWQVGELTPPPRVTRVGELALPLTCCSTQDSGPCIPSDQRTRIDNLVEGTSEPSLRPWEKASWCKLPTPVCLLWQSRERAIHLACGYELTHLNINFRCELQEHVKKQTYRAKPRHRTSYPRGAPVEAHYRQCNRSKRSQTRPTTASNEQVQVKMSVLKGKRCDSTGHATASMMRVFFLLCSVSTFSFKFCFASGEVARGKRGF